jgi:hypothetical protein
LCLNFTRYASGAIEITSQPNVTELEISPRLWVIVLITGIGAGLTSGLLMKLLRAAQHLSYAYHRGDFLQGVEQVSGTRSIGGVMRAENLAPGEQHSAVRGAGVAKANAGL